MIRLEQIRKAYTIETQKISVLENISLLINKGEFVAITGPSGAGKSTLMSMIGCLDKPDEGSYFIDGQPVVSLNGNELAALRRRKFGFVFQAFNLIPRLTVLQNVELPMVYAGLDDDKCLRRAIAVLRAVGMEKYVSRRPNQLSGGQQQRVAIARALVNNPPVIIADEPTGNLDSETASTVIDLLKTLNEAGKTVLYVTHDEKLVKHAQRVVHVADGKVRELR